MATEKALTGHVRMPPKKSIASVIRFDPPAKIYAIRVGKKLVASNSIEAPGIAKVSDEALSEYKTDYVVEEFTRLIVNTVNPTVLTVEWTEVP